MDETSLPTPDLALACDIGLEYMDRVSFAVQQAGTPLVDAVVLTNTSERAIEDLVVTARLASGGCEPWTGRLARLDPGVTARLEPERWKLSATELAARTEGERTTIDVKVAADQKSCRASFDLDLLAYDQWPGAGILPELTAAFVTPNHSLVAELLRGARKVLTERGERDAIDGYQSASRQRAALIAEACFLSLAEQKIGYINPPASFEKTGQRVRLIDRVMRERFGTCLDLSLVLMGLFEQAGLHAVLLLPEGHAMPAFWTHQSSLPEMVIDEPARIRNLMELGEIVAIESTHVTHQAPTFAGAIEAARKSMNAPGSSFTAVDLKSCRKRGVRPLPLREGELPGIDPVAITDAAPLGDASALGSVLLAERADANEPKEYEQIESSHQRIGRWQSRLLDLSLRNRLINFKDTLRTLPLSVPDIGRLEDLLALEERLRILPGIEGDDAFYREELEAGRVHADATEADTQKRLLTIYRTALSSIEETGANLLHLALGSLVWYETPTSETPRRAPLVMIPVRLVRSTSGAGYVYTVELSDEPARANITLLEKIHTEFGIDARGLADLPEDEAGIDLPMVLRNFRSAIRDSARWEVEETAHLGLFSFNKFLMWRDLKENLSALRTNRLVDHLVERPGEEFDTAPFPDASTLDDELEPGTPLCTRDADSSQLVAVCAASQGRSFVLEGPPGTGKSQTIANMIADALAGGKRVLFVAEKLAALSVVRKRLEQDGLGPFCLELHSAKASKKEVLEQLRAALDAEAPALNADWDEHCLQLGVTRAQLNTYVEELHRTRDSGESLYQALGAMNKLGAQKEVGLPVEDASRVTADELDLWRRCLQELTERSAPVEPVSEHPLLGIGVAQWDFTLTDRVRSAITAASKAHGRLAKVLTVWLDGTSLGTSPHAFTQRDIGTLLEIARALLSSPWPARQLLAGREAPALRDRLRKALDLGRERDAIRKELGERYQPEFLSIEHLVHLDSANQAKDQIALFRFFRARAIRGKLRVYARKEVPKLEALITDLERALQARRLQDELAAMGDLANALGAGWNNASPDWDALAVKLDWCDRFAGLLESLAHQPQFAQGLTDLACDSQLCEKVRQPTQELIAGIEAWQEQWETARKTLVTDDLRAYGEDSAGWIERAGGVLARWGAGTDDLNNWCVYNASRDSAVDAGLAQTVAGFEAGVLEREELQPTFEAGFAREWFNSVANSVEAIRTFNAELHESQIGRFRALDKATLAMTKAVVAGRLALDAPSASVRASSQSEIGILRRELEKKRRHLPTRKLIERLPNLLPRLKPCFLMSPLSVAQFLDPSMPKFDIVVFDEASQIPVWDAVGAIARGSEVIVVGDSKQLPPTSFFRTLDGGDDDAQLEEGDVEDMESILKECNASGIPALRLKWHYRSRHESLIAFSNYHYYQNELMTFPSPEERSTSMGVTFTHVPNGVYDRGGTGTNRIEAEHVVDEVVRMLQDPDDHDSIGIVTFNQAQQTLIQDLFDTKRREYPEIERHFTDQTEEPVFVKNLENVQGDERDTIIFSVGYGPDATGRTSMNFGPLNKEGGERRLNVAVTRARRRLMVMSSMTSDMIDLRRTRVTGVAHFKQFLDYAQRGPEALETFAGHSTKANTDARFEHALRDRLIERGYEVDERVGCAGYRIDLAIRDAKNPGRYLLGIECDGKQYQSANTARDRDRTRPSVLKGLGWNLHRVWSTQWHVSPDKCLAQIDAAVVAARDAQCAPKAEEPIVPPEPLIAYAAVSAPKQARTESVYRAATPGRYRVGQRDIYAPESDELLTRWLGMIVETEAPIVQELALRRLAAFCELSSVRERFRGRFSDVLGHMLARGYVRLSGQTLWNPGDEPSGMTEVRTPGDEPESKRDADQIPPEEYVAAVVAVVREQFGLPRADLQKEAAAKLGFMRMTVALAPMLDAAIESALAEALIVEREGTLSLSQSEGP